MVTKMHNRISTLLLLIVTACFGFQGCSDSDSEEENLEQTADADASVPPLDAGAIGGNGAVGAGGANLPGNTGIPGGDMMGAPQTPPPAAPAAPVATAPANGAQGSGEFANYTVKRGDWLSKIAGRAYGDVHKWNLIVEANPQITNPNRIYPGQVLRIPITGPSSRAFADSVR